MQRDRSRSRNRSEDEGENNENNQEEDNPGEEEEADNASDSSRRIENWGPPGSSDESETGLVNWNLL